jgi:hypothetical protein
MEARMDRMSRLQEELHDALYSDMEHGVKWLNEEAALEFTQKYPALNVFIERFMDLETEEGE